MRWRRAWTAKSNKLDTGFLMTRSIAAAFFCATALAVCMPLAATSAPPPSATTRATPAKPGTEPLSVGETTQQAVENGDGVAAIVNDTVITDYDLRQRVALYVATSGVRTTPDSLKQIHKQVLQQLETERLELLEAQKNNITVSSGDVDKALNNVMKDNNLTQDQLNTMLARNGVHVATLRAQFAAQIAWSKTVQQQYSDRIDVAAGDVDAELQRISENKNKAHFLVAEIFQAVDNPEDDAKVKKSMDDLEVQLRAGAPFQTVARQFSQNPTAASGGDLGVVVEGQLPKELNDELIAMRPGMVSDPIKSTGGYYILFLRSRQEGANTKVADTNDHVNPHPDSLPLARILFPVGPKPAKDLLTRVMDLAGQVRTHIENCDHLADIAHQIKGVVYMNLGTMRTADLSPEIQNALAQTASGETTTPFQSAAGVELIIRCDKAVTKVSAFRPPTRDEVEEQLFEERMGVLSRQYLRDLRRNAEIQLPGEGLFARHHKDDADNQQ